MKDKFKLRLIAQDWCKGILEANDPFGFINEKTLSEEDVEYVIDECMKLAKRITSRPTLFNTKDIVERHCK